MQHERLQFVPTGDPPLSSFAAFPGPDLPLDYGLGLMSAGGYLGHNGEVTGYEAIIAHDLRTGTTIVEVQNATVSIGERRDPSSDLDVVVPDLVLPSVVGILGQPAGTAPTAPAAAPLSCRVPVVVPAFTA